MVNESYIFYPTKKTTRYFFESEGIKGKVIKIVIFSKIGENRWNLGFGDWKNGQPNDSVVTNNHDIKMVLSTVAKITYMFFEYHPECIIEINPVDERRKQLYNLVFRRNFADIEPNFELIGFYEKKAEPYSIEKTYDYFELKLKNQAT